MLVWVWLLFYKMNEALLAIKFGFYNKNLNNIWMLSTLLTIINLFKTLMSFYFIIIHSKYISLIPSNHILMKLYLVIHLFSIGKHLKLKVKTMCVLWIVLGTGLFIQLQNNWFLNAKVRFLIKLLEQSEYIISLP